MIISNTRQKPYMTGYHGLVINALNKEARLKSTSRLTPVMLLLKAGVVTLQVRAVTLVYALTRQRFMIAPIQKTALVRMRARKHF